MSVQPEAISNHLLVSLPRDAVVSLLPKLTRVTLESRMQLYAPESSIEAVYFIEAGMVSLVANLEAGVQLEVGTVGREGMLGTSLILENKISFFEAMVQMPGTALKMNADDFANEIKVSSSLRSILLRYSEALHLQAMQTAACNGHHRLEQRLARWLLTAHDQIDRDEVPVTQEFLAMMLGVHRPSVTIAASNLQRSGVIKQFNGRVTILDRLGLEAFACECYDLTRRWSAMLIRSTKD